MPQEEAEAEGPGKTTENEAFTDQLTQLVREREKLLVESKEKERELEQLKSERKELTERVQSLTDSVEILEERVQTREPAKQIVREMKDDNAVSAELVSGLGLKRTLARMLKDGSVDLNDDTAFKTIDRLLELEAKEVWIDRHQNRGRQEKDPEVVNLLQAALGRLQKLEQREEERGIVEEISARLDATISPIASRLQKLEQELAVVASGDPRAAKDDAQLAEAITGVAQMLEKTIGPRIKTEATKRAETPVEPDTQPLFDQVAKEVSVQFAEAARTRPELDRGIGWTEMMYPHFGPGAQPLAVAFIEHLRSKGRLVPPAIQPYAHQNGWTFFHKSHQPDLVEWMRSDEYRRLTSRYMGPRGERR